MGVQVILLLGAGNAPSIGFMMQHLHIQELDAEMCHQALASPEVDELSQTCFYISSQISTWCT